MTASRQRRLYMLFAIMALLAVVTALVLYALRQNISLFYTPTQLVKGEAPTARMIRIGGMVVPHSIHRSEADLSVEFEITDYHHTVTVVYRGILPDLFREGQGIVAMGVLIDKDHVKASEVLAKHDENYMPPEVKSALGNRLKKTKRVSL